MEPRENSRSTACVIKEANRIPLNSGSLQADLFLILIGKQTPATKLRGSVWFGLLLLHARAPGSGKRRFYWCELNPSDRMGDSSALPHLPTALVFHGKHKFLFSLQPCLQIFKVVITWKTKHNNICLSCNYVFMTLAVQSKFLFIVT